MSWNSSSHSTPEIRLQKVKTVYLEIWPRPIEQAPRALCWKVFCFESWHVSHIELKDIHNNNVKTMKKKWFHYPNTLQFASENSMVFVIGFFSKHKSLHDNVGFRKKKMASKYASSRLCTSLHNSCLTSIWRFKYFATRSTNTYRIIIRQKKKGDCSLFTNQFWFQE